MVVCWIFEVFVCLDATCDCSDCDVMKAMMLKFSVATVSIEETIGYVKVRSASTAIWILCALLDNSVTLL